MRPEQCKLHTSPREPLWQALREVLSLTLSLLIIGPLQLIQKTFSQLGRLLSALQVWLSGCAYCKELCSLPAFCVFCVCACVCSLCVSREVFHGVCGSVFRQTVLLHVSLTVSHTVLPDM